MADIKKDLYDLTYSEDIVIGGIEEKSIDLTLDTSATGTSTITGKVIDNDGNPVVGATVKLFDASGVPFAHTLTDATGNYTFSGLSSATYQISSVKTGIVLTVPTSIYLQDEEVKTHNFNVTYDLTLDLCSIAGHIFGGEEGKTKISGAYVSLLNATTRETVATTSSASDGEYVFYDVVAGNYILVATKQGYKTSSDTTVTAIDHTVVNTNITLTSDPVQNVGTISGVIKHNNAIVPNAFVGLYKVTGEDNETITLVATTKTNTSGIYMFGNVESGKYMVKSKLNK